MYATDFDGLVSRNASSVSAINRNVFSEVINILSFAEAYHWEAIWQPYTKNAQVFLCPSGLDDFCSTVRHTSTRGSGGLPRRELWGHYGFNYEGLCKTRPPYAATLTNQAHILDVVPRSAEGFLVMDSWSDSPAVDGTMVRVAGSGAAVTFLWTM